MPSLGLSRAFLVRRIRKKKRRKEGQPFAIKMKNGVYPKRKGEMREKEKDLENRIPQRPSD